MWYSSKLIMSGNEGPVHQRQIHVNTAIENEKTTKSENVSSQIQSTSCWQKNDKSHANPKNGSSESECTICYQILLEDDKVVLEECGHIFHSKCIRQWMLQKRTCPFCAGFSLLPEDYPRLI